MGFEVPIMLYLRPLAKTIHRQSNPRRLSHCELGEGLGRLQLIPWEASRAGTRSFEFRSLVLPRRDFPIVKLLRLTGITAIRDIHRQTRRRIHRLESLQ